MAHWQGYMHHGWYAIGGNDEDIQHYQWFETQAEAKTFILSHLENYEEWTLEHWDKDVLCWIKTFKEGNNDGNKD